MWALKVTFFQRLIERFEQLLPLVYCIWALPFCVALAVIVPPNNNADEGEHFTYALRIADGSLIGTLHDGKAGSFADPGGLAAINHFARSAFHPEIKTTLADFRLSQTATWTSERTFFARAAPYPPFLYIPQTTAVLLA